MKRFSLPRRAAGEGGLEVRRDGSRSIIFMAVHDSRRRRHRRHHPASAHLVRPADSNRHQIIGNCVRRIQTTHRYTAIIIYVHYTLFPFVSVAEINQKMHQEWTGRAHSHVTTVARARSHVRRSRIEAFCVTDETVFYFSCHIRCIGTD